MTNPELEYEVAGGFVRIVFRRPMIIGSDRDDSRNGDITGKDTGNVTKQSLSSHQVVTKLSSSIPMICDLLEKMISPMSAKEMRQFCGLKDATYFKTTIIDTLIEGGLVAMTQPD